jgi:hypothetical protein
VDLEEARSHSYRVRRYMDHLSDSSLEARAEHILLNLGLDAPVEVLVNASPLGWSSLWGDVIDEANRRFGDTAGAALLDRVTIKCNSQWLARPPVPASQADDFLARSRAEGFFLVRYSKRKYLAELLTNGAIRFSPASSYKDPSLNHAIQDDELTIDFEPNPSEIRLELMDRKTGLPKDRLTLASNLLSAKSQTDYYILCLSGFLSPELFHDFGADSCVLVKKPETFLGRLFSAAEARLPDWGGKVDTVKYLDPLNSTFSDIRTNGIFFSKHFRYTYQHEWRVVLSPPTFVRELPYLDLELGNLADCCELLSLD